MLITTTLSSYACVTVVSSLVRTAFAVLSDNCNNSISFEINDHKFSIDNSGIYALSVISSPVTEPFYWYAYYKYFKEGSYSYHLNYKNYNSSQNNLPLDSVSDSESKE